MTSGPILRVFTARPRPGAESLLVEKLRSVSTALVRDQPGCLAWIAAGPSGEGDSELTFITLWESAASLLDFAGPDVSESVLPDGYAELMESHRVDHLPVHAHGTAGS